MKKFKQYLGFVLVIAIITVGGVVLGIEYENAIQAALGIAGAFTCFGIGALLGWYLDHKNMLPE